MARGVSAQMDVVAHLLVDERDDARLKLQHVEFARVARLALLTRLLARSRTPTARHHPPPKVSATNQSIPSILAPSLLLCARLIPLRHSLFSRLPPSTFRHLFSQLLLPQRDCASPDLEPPSRSARRGIGWVAATTSARVTGGRVCRIYIPAGARPLRFRRRTIGPLTVGLCCICDTTTRETFRKESPM